MTSWLRLPRHSSFDQPLRPAGLGGDVAESATVEYSRASSDLRLVAVRYQLQTGCVQSCRVWVRRDLTAMGFLLLCYCSGSNLPLWRSVRDLQRCSHNFRVSSCGGIDGSRRDDVPVSSNSCAPSS